MTDQFKNVWATMAAEEARMASKMHETQTAFAAVLQHALAEGGILRETLRQIVREELDAALLKRLHAAKGTPVEKDTRHG